MLIKQISIFVENKQGRLSAITNILKENNIDIRALSIADTKDFGILRLIVDNPSKAYEALKGEECTVTITDVIGIGLEDKPGGLSDAMEILDKNHINVEYMYAFISESVDTAFVILRVEDNDKGIGVLTRNNIRVLNSSEIHK
ncbi:MAG TPA: acetolactate synthase [Ruminococcus sp.]|nr:acetolactate synthase [Ruminococcus sp.]